MIELTKEYIDHLKDIITEKDDAKIKEILDELYPADIAELYQELDLQETIYWQPALPHSTGRFQSAGTVYQNAQASFD